VTAIATLLRECRADLGVRTLVTEMAVIPALVVVWVWLGVVL
jgi:hypothetical protein